MCVWLFIALCWLWGCRRENETIHHTRGDVRYTAATWGRQPGCGGGDQPSGEGDNNAHILQGQCQPPACPKDPASSEAHVLTRATGGTPACYRVVLRGASSLKQQPSGDRASELKGGSQHHGWSMPHPWTLSMLHPHGRDKHLVTHNRQHSWVLGTGCQGAAPRGS